MVPNPSPRWLSLYLSGTPKMTHNLLVRELVPTLHEAAFLPWISNWFFVRYWDELPQLRFRVLVSKLKEAELKGSLENRLAHYLKDHQLWGMEWKSYVPDLERYSVTNMDAVEELFRWQSEHALQLFQEKRGEEKRLSRILQLLPQLLQSTYPSLHQQKIFIKTQRDYFQGRIQFSTHSKKAISKAYRKLAPQLDIEELLATTSATLTPPIENMAVLFPEIQGKTESERSRILRDIFHMGINKCFLTDHDQWEFLIYEFLDRAYASHIARSKEQ
ncbi:hypothetical protein MTsPCn9_10650 [Croceitalea sp. MTPC9]|nr:hypothetical protein MTsPCn6_26590 [Croceitalea sp. MTPC6]GMN16129.1 hypothetical protein MTsPCn9_10650 [Croceitalea sp. MTPC9]